VKTPKEKNAMLIIYRSIQLANALSEGYDLNEYKPWKDATITPHRGCIQTLRQMRCTMLEPWPAEESRAKDECSRILHVMREQLNVVINLQSTSFTHPFRKLHPSILLAYPCRTTSVFNICFCFCLSRTDSSHEVDDQDGTSADVLFTIDSSPGPDLD
jgi:hypothetical protein